MRADYGRRVHVPPFQRRFYGVPERFTRIGGGALGGKANGLLFMRAVVESIEAPPRIELSIPTLTVIGTELFDRFIDENGLHGVAASEWPDDRIALAFQQASLPGELVGDLRALIEQIHSPLAVRSSSRLEDSLTEPFAGVFVTKMIPNNQFDADSRFRRLVEAVKFVYASTFFADARAYRQATGHTSDEDAMAVIIQEVVGRRHTDRYYPDVSGVARSYAFYRSARARPEDGLVALALGLGRTIVDDGIAWNYSPAYPAAPPPATSTQELADSSQRSFWAVNMGRPPAHDPIRETEYLTQASLEAAEEDGTLRFVASTYDPMRERLVPGVGVRGARVLDFAPLLALRAWPISDAIRGLLQASEKAVEGPVEIEFAVTLDESEDRARVGLLQVRPMARAVAPVDVTLADLDRPDVVVASPYVMGNGSSEEIRDIVYVRPERFEARHGRQAAGDIATFNASLAAAGLPYLLVGFGRWGSSDPWLGLQVTWAQISGARVIVEAALPAFHAELSQGSHFFHNISSQGVSYFSITTQGRIDWKWFDSLPAVRETTLVRHVQVERPLLVRVDGRTGRGIIATPRQ